MDCPICPSSPCTPEYHTASASIRASLRARVQSILSQPSRAELTAPRRYDAARRLEGSPAIEVREPKRKKSKETFSANGRAMASQAIEKLAQGATYAEIAREFGVKFMTIAKWLSLARKYGSDEMKAALDKLHTCQCGGRKIPSASVCTLCKRAEKRRAA